MALAALAFAYPLNAQDPSRLGLTQSIIVHGSISIDRYANETGDRALHDGHWYSDKAPGMSFVALPLLAPGFEVLRLAGLPHPETRVPWNRWPLLFGVRVATGGLAFLLAVLLLWHVADLLRPRTGGLVAVTFGLGTLSFPFAATVFGHVAAGLLAFAAWSLAWRRHASPRSWPVIGLLAGAAVLFEYQAALAAVVVLGYLLVRTRHLRSTVLFLAGALPPAIVLGAYNWAAFGSPIHFSYGYVLIPEQHDAVFGISLPTWEGLHKVLLAEHGLLRQQPVLLFAAAGLVLLWRRGLRAEASACAAVVVAFVLMTSGYFDPYGGVSPGPRFFVPALPFLAIGLAEAFDRWRLVTTLAAVVSTGRMILAASSWNPGPDWPTVWTHLGLSTTVAAILVAAPAAAALAVVFFASGAPPPRRAVPMRSWRRWPTAPARPRLRGVRHT